ncbi:peflin [Octopus bimaculoides]|uniref:EF-hand domain-containing protein n=1 Tax=Octopus bimaculoides TaxID=37653 RepID=A0A0L8G3R4_OCTBM|nr:peflin [Octopus bimaculoides]|eukprot:XP_014784470.1 PREDICTED: peflin-like [Octopus bimaculoides]
MAHQWSYGQNPPLDLYSNPNMAHQQYIPMPGQVPQMPQYTQFQPMPGQSPYGQPPYGYPVPQGFPPTQPTVPPGIDPEVYNWFISVDADHSGKISAKELQQALIYGNWKHANDKSARLMISMFSKDHSESIDLIQFQHLWKFLQDMQVVFNRFDPTRSGKIGMAELQTAYQQIGFSISPRTISIIMMKFAERQGALDIASFIHSCLLLHLLTNSFKQRCQSSPETASMHYDDYMLLVATYMF